LTTERTPLEAGLNFMVKTQSREFTGKQAMLDRERSAESWQMHLIELDPHHTDPFYMHTIFTNGQAIGVVTSGAYGHRVNKSLALAYFKNMPESGNQIQVLILGELVNARILDKAPYDPGNLNMKS
jgi:dimethylglycine dehydrogenase